MGLVEKKAICYNIWKEIGLTPCHALLRLAALLLASTLITTSINTFYYARYCLDQWLESGCWRDARNTTHSKAFCMVSCAFY